MKTSALILGAISAAALLAVLYSSESQDLMHLREAETQFQEFKLRFNRSYTSLSEQMYRFNVFQNSLRIISEINSNPRNTFTAAVNQFADLSFEEFSSYYLAKMPAFDNGKCSNQTAAHTDIPDNFNWSDQGKVQKPTDQAFCGSCWAFSAAGAIESAHAIKTGELPSLSVQELVDCSKIYGNQGCSGGLMNLAFDYVIDRQLHTTEEYPYAGYDQKCMTDSKGEGKYTISCCVKVGTSIEELTEAIAIQPVSVAFHVTSAFMYYHSGIYNPWLCVGEVNHGVLAVGYSKTDKTPYFIVKNSWGETWGEKGFFKIAMGKGDGTCKIVGSGFNYYPLI